MRGCTEQRRASGGGQTEPWLRTLSLHESSAELVSTCRMRERGRLMRRMEDWTRARSPEEILPDPSFPLMAMIKVLKAFPTGVMYVPVGKESKLQD